MTQIIKASDMSLLLEALDQGQLISIPTETVYGLACRFNDREALEKLLEVKGRDRDKPITLMIAYKEDIGQYGYVNERIQRVIDEFMPGSITLILKRKKSVDPAMTGGLDTVGIRIPNSPFVLSLLEAGELLVGGTVTTNGAKN